jgi:hypothetical protein
VTCVRRWSQRCLFSLVCCMAIAGMASPCAAQEAGDAAGRPARTPFWSDDVLVKPPSLVKLGNCGRLLATGIFEVIECPPAHVQWLASLVVIEDGTQIQLGFRGDGVVVWRRVTSWPPSPSEEETPP